MILGVYQLIPAGLVNEPGFLAMVHERLRRHLECEITWRGGDPEKAIYRPFFSARHVYPQFENDMAHHLRVALEAEC